MTNATKDRYQIRHESAAQFDKTEPEPAAPTFAINEDEGPTTYIHRHSEGRAWLELCNVQQANSTTQIELFITIGSDVHRLTMSASAASAFIENIGDFVDWKTEIDTLKAMHNQQYKEWREAIQARSLRRESFVEAAEAEWRASLPAKPPANVNNDQDLDDFDDDDDFDPDADDDSDDE